jgi:small subunit ribosomal protein S9
MPEERDEAAREPDAAASDVGEAGASEEPDAGASEVGEAGAPQEPEAGAPQEPEAGASEHDEASREAEPEAGGDETRADDVGAGEGLPSEERERPRRRRRRKDEGAEDEVIPGAHLEPDLVLQEEQTADVGYGELAEAEMAAAEEALAEEPSAEVEEPTAEPVAREPLDLAADARYGATGKRKSAVARVILRPGEGSYTINGRHLDEYFPRVRLQRMARQPLEVAGYQARMDVAARIHGGGVSAQAMALRHGIARALVEADPALRGELKGRGYLTRDPRVKERKKAGLKKARKRPQFSKR